VGTAGWQTTWKFVIPNRPEGAVRNLLVLRS
jgi:hypothetical protein